MANSTKIRSARGTIVDFDLIKLKQDMAIQEPIEVAARKKFLDLKQKRRIDQASKVLPESLSKMISAQSTAQSIPVPDVKIVMPDASIPLEPVIQMEEPILDLSNVPVIEDNETDAEPKPKRKPRKIKKDVVEPTTDKGEEDA
jgi:hypothetical protein